MYIIATKESPGLSPTHARVPPEPCLSKSTLPRRRRDKKTVLLRATIIATVSTVSASPPHTSTTPRHSSHLKTGGASASEGACPGYKWYACTVGAQTTTLCQVCAGSFRLSRGCNVCQVLGDAKRHVEEDKMEREKIVVSIMRQRWRWRSYSRSFLR